MKSRKSRKLTDSFNYAIRGLLYCLRTQRNMRIHFVVAALVLLLAILTKVSALETVVLLLCIGVVIMAEMINTAIETAVDLAHGGYHPLAAIAKDVSAGTVLVASVLSAVIGCIIFYDDLRNITFTVTNEVKHMPIHITIISLVVVTIAVIAGKAWSKKGTFLRGGMPSGHSALAMSLLTSIAFLSKGAAIPFLASVLTLMVMHSRLEAGVHTLWEIIVGALLGFFLTVLIFQMAV